MRNVGKKLCSVICAVALLLTCAVPGFQSSAVAYTIGILDANGNDITGSTITLEEAKNTKCSVTYIDCSEPNGSQICWHSSTGLIASVDEDGTIRARDSSRQARVQLWIDNDVKSIRGAGPSLGEQVETIMKELDVESLSAAELWNAFSSVFADLAQAAQNELHDALTQKVETDAVPITATLVDHNGELLTSAVVYVHVMKSTAALGNTLPNGTCITNKDALPTVVAVGTSFRIQNVITPVRLGMTTTWSLSTDSVLDLASNYADITEDGVITFKKAGTVTVTASPEFELFLSKIVDYLTETGDEGMDSVSAWLIDTLGMNVSQSTVSTALTYALKLGLKFFGVSKYISYVTTGNSVLKFLSNALMKASTNDKITFTIVDDLPLQSFDISCSDAYQEGDREQLYVTHLTPGGALVGETTWQISDPTAASITEDGFLRILDAGGVNAQKTVSVTATLNDISVTRSFTIYGTGAEPAGIDVSGPTHIMPGDSATFTALVYPARVDQTVSWGLKTDAGTVIYASVGNSAFNSSMRVYSDGTVTGLSLGANELYVRASNGVTEMIPVNIGAAVTSITLEEAPSVTYTVPIYNTYNETVQQLHATLTPEEVANPQVKWSLSDAVNLELTQDGQIHPVENKAAYGTVTAKSVDGGYTASAQVAFINVAVTGVSLSETSVTLKAGKTLQLQETVTPDSTLTGATIKEVTWKSDDPTVAAVDDSGTVYAVDRGTAAITCTTVDGLKTASCTVTVVSDKDALRELIALSDALDLTQIAAPQEDIDAFRAALALAKAVEQDESVYQITVDEAYEELAEAYEALSSIVEPENVYVTLDGSPVSFDTVDVGLIEDYRNVSRQFGYSIHPAGALIRSVRWSSSNDNVSVTQDGLASPTVNSAQYSQITVTITNHRGWEISGSLYVAFARTPVTDLTFSQTEVSGYAGDTGQVEYTIAPKGVAGVGAANIQDLIWETSDPSVVTADADGTLHYLGIGTATVTATTVDGGKTASCTVTVTLDRTALLEKITESDQLSSTLYTVESWQQMWAVRSRAVSVYLTEDSKTSQAEINNAAAELSAAIRALVLIQNIGSVTLTVNGADVGDTYTAAVSGGSASVDLDYRLSPTDTTLGTVRFSSDTSAITVSEDGVCTPAQGAPCYGSVTVTVTDYRGNTATDSVRLCFAERPATGVSVTPSAYTADSVSAAPITLSALVSAANGQPASIQDVRWVSESPIVSVSDSGTLSFSDSGVAIVKAYSIDGDFSASATITVLGDKTQLYAAMAEARAAAIIPSNYTNATYTVYAAAYQRADEVYNGLTYTQAQIDAAAADLRAALHNLEPLVVIESLVITHDGSPAAKYNSVKVPLSSSYKNQSFSLGYRVTPADVEYKSVTWTSSDSNMSVDQNGTVKPTKNSAVASKIMVTVTDYYGRTYSDWVYVSFANYPVTGVTVSPTSLSLSPGETASLTNEITPKGTLGMGSASIKTVLWESSDPRVATVNNGVVTAVDGGTAQIRCITADGGFTATCSVSVTVDKSALNQALAEARAINGASYTPESFAALQEAIQEGDAVSAKTYATTAEVAAARSAILTAIAQLAERPTVQLTPSEGSSAVVDETDRFVYGVLPGTADVLSLFTTTANGSLVFTPAANGGGTGSIITMKDEYGDAVDTFTLVIFGDVSGDSLYDGTDAYFVRLVANGMISADSLTHAQRMAADCNHDGVIDAADVALLEQAGLLLESVDQTLPNDELQMNSVYLEYCGLIDQVIEINVINETAPDKPQEEAAAEQGSTIERILSFLRSVMTYLFHLLFVKI
ncbi:MAG: Ig-like domain-containing protein [Clostridia bacterium]|nr:Ig-like domain-containing protein [Clostridia bacterium]